MPVHEGSTGTVDSPPGPPVTPPIEFNVTLRSTGPTASYAIQFSNEIVNTSRLESGDTVLSPREAEGTLSSGDVDVYTGRAGVLRVANAGSSGGPIEVAIVKGETYTIRPGEMLALRFVPGPIGPIVLPETVFGLPSDAAAAGGFVGALALLSLAT